MIEQVPADTPLQDSYGRQGFLLRLGEALWPLSDAAEIEHQACRLLAERLDVDRAYYVDVDEASDTARVGRDFVRGDAPSLAGEHRLADFAWSVAILRRGDCHVVADTQTSALVPPADRAACAALRIIACMGAPLIKDGRLLGALCVADARRRDWRASDVELVREVGERIWAAVQRGRAEQALRESEVRLRQAMDAARAGSWRVNPGTGEFIASDRALALHGLPPGTLLTHERALARVHPDDRPAVEAAVKHAMETAEPFRQEHRVLRPDGSIGWVASHAELRPEAGQTWLVGLVQDITDRKQAEAALLESEQRFRTLVESSAQAVWEATPDGRQEGDSPSWRAYTGQSVEEMRGHGWANAVHPDDRAYAERAWGDAVAAACDFDAEFRLRGPDGQWRWTQVHAAPLRDARGTVTKWVGMNVDVSARRQAEDALRLERDKLQALIDSAAVGIVVASPTFEILTMNPEALRIHGFASQEEMFTQLDRYAQDFALYRPDGRPLPFDDWPAMRTLHGESCFDEELMLVRPRIGLRRSVRYRVVPVTGSAGEVIVHLVNVLDLSDIRQAQHELKASEERLALALASANAGSWDWDVRSGAVVWSPVHYRLYGYPVGGVEPSYHAWRCRVHPDDLPEVEARLRRCIQQRETDFADEFRVVWPDGSLHWLDARGKVHSDAEGTSRMYGVAVEVTERKRAEIELRRARDELEQRVHERTAELRQRGDQLARLASELVLAEQRERRQLARLLHDGLQQLLASARYELDSVLPRVAIDAQPAVQRAIEVLNESIKASRVLTVELSPPILHDSGLAGGLQWLANWVRGKHGLAVDLRLAAADFGEREDVRLLLFESVREALFNVVKHAGVREARVTASHGEGNRLRVVVGDDGRGFDVASLGAATQTLAGGFGLLSIRERVSLLGGKLQIESAPGGGTRLTMEVPSTGPAAAGPGAPAQAAGGRAGGGGNGKVRIRVLLVDDHPVVRKGLAALLASAPDIEVAGEASSGEEAIALAGVLEPEVMLMDYSMPGMGGLEATRQVHSRWPSIRIVGLSMYDEPAMATAMRAAGASAYVTKGGDAATLLAAVRAGR